MKRPALIHIFPHHFFNPIVEPIFNFTIKPTKTAGLVFITAFQSDMSIEAKIGVKSDKPGVFVSNAPFDDVKSLQTGHGYSGYLIGQALIVAIKASPEGFAPHSLNSLFTTSLDPTKVITWEIDEINNGNSFVNRSIRALQNGKIVYLANVSLTKRNSLKKANEKYQEYLQIKKESKVELDDDEIEPVKRPFGFQTPSPKWLKQYTPEDSNLVTTRLDDIIELRQPPQFHDLKVSRSERNLPITNRKLSLFAKWNLHPSDKALNYFGLATISDSVMLSSLRRILRIDDTKTGYTNRSIRRIDNVIYFHDEDFDPSNWVSFSFNLVRFANNRALLEGEIFNDQGVHVCSVFQEGLVSLDDVELRAKL